MLISRADNGGLYQINTYTPGSIKINDNEYHANLVIGPHLLITDWPVQALDQININDFDFLLETRPDIFIFGTGTTTVFPDKSLWEFCSQHKIGLECMSTAAACRTYTVLASEQRKVLAGLFI